MSKPIKKLHPSNVVYLIYSSVGSTFSFNDIGHMITNSQLQGIYRKGYIFKTGSIVKSKSLTKPNNYIPEWQISKLGFTIMNQLAMKKEMDMYRKEISVGRCIMSFFTNIYLL